MRMGAEPRLRRNPRVATQRPSRSNICADAPKLADIAMLKAASPKAAQPTTNSHTRPLSRDCLGSGDGMIPPKPIRNIGVTSRLTVER
jgi:hypothetical protein